MQSNYQPISCHLHDYLEHFATQQEVVQVVWIQENNEKKALYTKILDLKTKEAKEFILLAEYPVWIRLDRLVKVGNINFQGPESQNTFRCSFLIT